MLAGDVDMPRLLHPNQSITFKGAVRLARRRGAGSHLHANASLFTCLVMDMPLEKLKLRWALGTRERGLGAGRPVLSGKGVCVARGATQ